MKKRLFGIFLALTLAFTCFAVAACGDDGNKETPIGDPVTVELNYAEDTGVLSWDAVEGATKYKIRISNLNDAAKSEETAETTMQLYLRRGTSRISLIAEDEQGRERGNGSKTVTLETDFGAPAAVTGVAFDKTAGTLGWSASEGAVKYLVSATSVNDESFVAVTDLEVTGTSAALALGKGIYDITVVAVNENGAKSLAANYRYASYVDSAYGTEIADGVYKLFDFEDDDVIDLSRFASDYKAWSQEAIKPAWSIVNKHEKLEDYTEADTVDFESKALKVRADYNADGDTLTRTGAVTFTLPQPLENWGRLYYDMFRTNNPPAGVLLTDVTGRRVLKSVEYSHGATLGQWGTVSFTKSEVLASEPEFGALAEISFVLVNGRGGVAYFDNVRYDLVDLGYFGKCNYRRSTDTFTFDEVAGAKKYEMYVDGATAPIELTETEYAFDPALTTGNHEIRIVAINGESTREHTYDLEVGERPAFNVEETAGSGEYVLADFNTVEYREYFETTAREWNGRYYNYAISGGKLNITHNEDWGNGNLLYTLPTAIDGAKVVYFNGITGSHSIYLGVVFRDSWTYTDGNGKEQSTNFMGIYFGKTATPVNKSIEIPAERANNPIVAIKIMATYESDGKGVEKTISIDEITYLTENGVGRLGDNCKYLRSSELFTFDAAYNAESYELYVDDATSPLTADTNSYSFANAPLAVGTHTIRVVAKRGAASREHTYTVTLGEKIKFNVETSTGSNEYILADFETIEYREYLTLVGSPAPQYEIKNGSLVYTGAAWGGKCIRYLFPQAIDKNDVLSLNLKFASSGSAIAISLIDENGKTVYAKDFGVAETSYSFTYDKIQSLEGTKIAGIQLSCQKDTGTITVDEITYEKYTPIANFNEKKSDSEEYLLADFTVNGYKRYLTLENAAYSLSDNKLVVTSNKGWSGVSVKYTLPAAITGAGEIRIKVTASDQVRLFNVYFSDGSKITAATPVKGANTLVMPIPADKRSLTVTAVEVGAVNASDTETRTVEVDEITYIPYTTETAFNSAVSDVENGKLLADFNANGYYDYLTIEGGTTWGNQPAKKIEGGALVMSLTQTGLNRYVKYTFASPINKEDLLTLQFIAKASSNYRVYVFDEAGNSAYRNFGASENYVTNANALSGYADYAKLTGKIVAIGFASNYADCYVDGKATVLTIDRIAYEYCDKITGFNELVSGSETDRLLADFNVNGYKNNLAVVGDHYNWGGTTTEYSVTGGELVIDKLIESGYNRVLKYTFPEPISKANVLSIKFRLTTTANLNMFAFDENGNKTDTKWLCGAQASMNTISWTGFTSLTGDKISAIGFTLNNWQNTATVHVDEITYEYIDPVTNFNSLVDGTENEYLLADFSVSGYKSYLENVGNGTYTLGENQITVNGVSWSTHYVKYTLPTPINVSDIEQIKVTVLQPAGGKHAALGVIDNAETPNMQGANNYQSFTLTIDTSKITGDKIVALYLSGNDATTPVTFTKITYTKKTA